MKHAKTHLLVVIASILCLMPVLAKPGGGNPNPGVLPPNSKAYGKTYGEWSALHWKWVYSLPADQHPLTDTADISEGQSGPVWFLGGSYAANPTNDGGLEAIVTRKGTIPEGKALFFPIVDAEGSVLEGNGMTEQELRDYANWAVDHATNLSCEVDGVPLNNLEAYRAESPLFRFGPLPENNLLAAQGYDAPEGAKSRAVSDGYFIMLAPLSAGRHTIHFTSALVFTLEEDGFDFTFVLDITYQLKVGRNRHADDGRRERGDD